MLPFRDSTHKFNLCMIDGRACSKKLFWATKTKRTHAFLIVGCLHNVVPRPQIQSETHKTPKNITDCTNIYKHKL